MSIAEYLLHHKKDSLKRRYSRKIDWDFVRKRFIQGCNFVQVAREIGYKTASSLSLRCKRELGLLLSDFQKMCFDRGNNALHASQFKKAMEGDTSMLTWLGKNRLRQADKLEMKDEKVEKLDLFLDVVKKLDPDTFEKQKKNLDES